jgi:hypothetical protein
MEQFISVEDVVANAQSVIPDADDKATNIMKQWVYLGVREIGVTLEDIKVAELYPEDNSVRKPHDIVIIDDIALLDAQGNEYQYHYRGPGKRIHTSTEPTSDYPVDISEDDYYIHLGSTGSGITRVVIRYYSLPIDEHGDIKIKQDYLVPLIDYLTYMWARRNKDKNLGLYLSIWNSQLLKAKARNRRVNPLAMKAISDKINSMIKKKFGYTF